MITLCLGGWRIRLGCSPAGIADAAAERYAPFIVQDSPADLEVQADFLPPVDGSPFQHGLLEARLVASSGGYLLDEPEIRGTIELSRGRASLRLSSSDPQRDLEYFLRIVVALVAHERGGLLLHAAGLVYNDRGRVFIGRSGSGKSTVVALSSHAAALGDDLMILRPDSTGWLVYGTPFWNWRTGNRLAQTRHARLYGIYKLVQSLEVRLSPMSPAAATAELVVNCPIVNGVDGLVGEVMMRCRQLAAAVPVQSLEFRKDATFWRVIEADKTTT